MDELRNVNRIFHLVIGHRGPMGRLIFNGCERNSLRGCELEKKYAEEV
jgi:hypothetical protein